MNLRLAIVLALSAVSACAPPTPIVEAPVDIVVPPISHDAHVHGDTRWTPLERVIVEDAFRDFIAFTEGHAPLSITWDLEERTLLELADKPRLIRTPWWFPPTHDVAGVAPDNMIRIVPDLCTGLDRHPELGACVRHELGHFAGMQHVGDPLAVMHDKSPGSRFTRADRAECERIGLCTRSTPP